MRLRTKALIAALSIPSTLPAQNIALVAENLYTMDAGAQGGPGMVLIHDGKIDDVRKGTNQQPPKGFEVIRGAYITPGLIDTDTTTGRLGTIQLPLQVDK